MDRRSKVALVTGGTRGIGRGICLRLAREGYTVAANFKTDEAQASDTLAALQAIQSRSIIVQADVSQPTLVDRMISEVVESIGRLDLLINNAGPWYDGGIPETTPEQWQTTLNDNLSSAFYCIRAALPVMRQQKSGCIINVGAMQSELFPSGDPYSPVFGLAKAAVTLMVRNLAHSEGRYGIRVNAVSPGLIETPDYANIPPEILAEQIARIPLGQLGQPEDVAAAVAFLASDEARYITGTILHVHGGLELPYG